ncbi:MAG: hypothetical protein J5685_11090 [Clostridiales bacterium]|nr:hypothetical protein [Clostridiales bacterium]
METSKKIYKFSLYFQLALGLFFLAAFLLVFASTFGALALLFLLWGGIRYLFAKKGKYPKLLTEQTILSTIITILLSLYIGLSSAFIISPLKYQYPLQIRYESHFNHPGEQFPAKLPKGASDYRFEAVPTILQGQGYVVVSFHAPSDFISSERARFCSSAIRTFKLGERYNNEVDLPYSEVFEEHPDADVYVVQAAIDQNHPHSEAVIIDGDFIAYSSL